MEKDPEWIRSMFADISSTYDLANTVLTASLDFYWRDRAAHVLSQYIESSDWYSSATKTHLLDACAGSGKLGQAVTDHFPGEMHVEAVDFCLPLLKEGLQSDIFDASFSPVGGDMMRIPCQSSSVDAMCMGFGYRNIADRSVALREIHRVLRKRRFFLVLEFHRPSLPVVEDLFIWYFSHVFPVIGRWVSGTTMDAYDYLQKSVLQFPSSEQLKEEFSRYNFTLRYHREFIFGLTHLYLLQTS